MVVLVIIVTLFTVTKSYSVLDHMTAGTDCNYCTGPSCTSTVYPAEGFDAKIDQQRIQQAVKGLGTAEDTLISVLTARSDYQRFQIAKEYITTGSTLVDDIADDTSGRFLGVLLALTKPLPLFYAEELHQAVHSKNYKAMIEILTSLPGCAIREISVVYRLIYRSILTKDISSHTRFKFETLMLALAKGERAENEEVNRDQANKDAKDLISAGVDAWWVSNYKFTEILTSRSFPQLRATFDVYDGLRKNKDKGYVSIIKDIEHLFTKKVEKTYSAIVKNVVNQPAFFAQELESALSGFVMAYDSRKVIRIMRGRCELDLYEIKQAYTDIYRKSLVSRVQEKTVSHFEKTLVALLK